MPDTTPARRAAFLVGGYVALTLGLVGIVVPLWPTTCFILFSAWCFSRSSPTMHRWLHENRLFGAQLQHYRDPGVITMRLRNGSVIMLWGAIGSSVLLIVNMMWLKVALLAIAAAISVHLVKLSNYARPAPAGPTLETRTRLHAWTHRRPPR